MAHKRERLAGVLLGVDADPGRCGQLLEGGEKPLRALVSFTLVVPWSPTVKLSGLWKVLKPRLV